MAIQKVTQEDFLIKTIDDMIKDLELRRAEIVTRMPQKEPAELADTWVGPSGKVFHIKRRKKA